MKGQIHITEFDNMPFYILHSIYYRYWLYTEDMRKQKEEEEKKGNGNTPPNKQNNLPMVKHTAANYQRATGQLLEDMEDEM